MNSVEQARKNFIEHALNEIHDTPNYSNFHTHTYFVIAKLGLQRKANADKLFETDDWNNLECRDAIFERSKHFLVKYIK